MTIPIDLGEAKRRFEKILATKGYSTRFSWGWRGRGEPKKLFYLLPIPSVPGLRGILWPESDGSWFGSISLRVGEDGEMLITGGQIKRAIKQSWAPPPFKQFLPSIEEERKRVLRWDLTTIHEPLAAVACDSLSAWFIKNEQQRKANAIINMFLRGEVSEATISEALSIVQYRVAKTRTERLHSGLIWRRVFG